MQSTCISDSGQSRVSCVSERTLEDNVLLFHTISLTVQYNETHLRTTYSLPPYVLSTHWHGFSNFVNPFPFMELRKNV